MIQFSKFWRDFVDLIITNKKLKNMKILSVHLEGQILKTFLDFPYFGPFQKPYFQWSEIPSGFVDLMITNKKVKNIKIVSVHLAGQILINILRFFFIKIAIFIKENPKMFIKIWPSRWIAIIFIFFTFFLPLWDL